MGLEFLDDSQIVHDPSHVGGEGEDGLSCGGGTGEAEDTVSVSNNIGGRCGVDHDDDAGGQDDYESDKDDCGTLTTACS